LFLENLETGGNIFVIAVPVTGITPSRNALSTNAFVSSGGRCAGSRERWFVQVNLGACPKPCLRGSSEAKPIRNGRFFFASRAGTP